MAHKVRVQAKDVAGAIAQGLKELGLRRDQAEVTVLESPKKGFLGFGSRPALVEIRQKRWTTAELDAQIYMDVPRKKKSSRNRGDRRGNKHNVQAHDERRRGGRKNFARTNRRDEAREKAPKANETQLLPSLEIQNAVIPENLVTPMQQAKEHLHQVLTYMGVKVENLHAWWDERQQRILLTFDCDHPAIVIGKEGKTLEAIQYLSTLALSRHFDKPISVITDTQNYWRKAEDKLNAEIEKGVSMITSGHSIFRFRPMSAQLRRYIHRALEGNTLVQTASEGEGKWRKVTLRPTAQALEAAKAHLEAAANFVPGVIGEDIPEEPTAAQQAVTEAEAEQAAQALNESASCCAGETCGDHCCCHDHASPVSAQESQAEMAHEPLTATQADDAQGATCQAELARNCGEGEEQVGCACEKVYESTTVEVVATSTENGTIVEQTSTTVTVQTEPAAQAEAQVPASEPVTDDAQGATCSAELARNCQADEVQTGCACGPLFETVAQAEENK